MKLRALPAFILAFVILLLEKPCFCQSTNGQTSKESSASSESNESSASSESTDFNRADFHKNKLELGFDAGWYPWNIPLLFDPLLGDKFAREPLLPSYTLVPLTLRLRWQLYDPRGPGLLRGNTELSFGGNYTVITQGPEDMFSGALVGVRYNFVQPYWRVVPYVDLQGGMGYTDAQEPIEAKRGEPQVGQGQDFTFTFIMGAGARYDFNSTYSVSAGIGYMHISNFYLSEPKYSNHGVNTVGPNFGINVALWPLLRALSIPVSSRQ